MDPISFSRKYVNLMKKTTSRQNSRTSTNETIEPLVTEFFEKQGLHLGTTKLAADISTKKMMKK
jgi:hypothetical protein